MFRFFARRLSLGLIAFGCGSPGDLDRDRFPPLESTGYPDRVGAAGAGGSFGVAGSGSVGGSAPIGGSSAGGQPGVAGQPGAGGEPAGVAGQPGVAGAGQGGSGSEPEPGGCPDDILVLLNRPGPMGGCAGGGCHVAGGTPPDLTSPGVEQRVLNVTSTCNNLPYVGSPMSLIEDKITNPNPACGAEMPLLSANRLSAEDEACILDWIDGLTGGM